ncbi:MAG: hypothetical protein E7401_01480 [Ruminococcaceae bacterium]|nr:hypothetical protein [Oscillospiraceae bacterium]
MTVSFSKILRYVFLLCALHIALFLVMFPADCIEVGRSAVNLCLNSVVPSLFPFLICSGFFSATGAATVCSRYLSPIVRPLFKVPGCGAMVLVLGVVSGYPVGAACAANLYATGQCTKAEAERLCAFCNNSGPLFIMSVVGCGFLGNAVLGRYLYFTHILSAILSGIVLGLFSRRNYESRSILPPKSVPAPKDTIFILGDVMDTSISSMLKICGFIVFFSVFAATLPKSNLTPYLAAILEITGGIKQLAALGISLDTKLCLISFFAAFSGISVMLQVGAITAPHRLSLIPYLFGKLMQGGFSVVIMKVLLRLFPLNQSTFLQEKSPAAFAAEPLGNLFYSLSLLFAALIGITAVISIIKLFKRMF